MPSQHRVGLILTFLLHLHINNCSAQCPPSACTGPVLSNPPSSCDDVESDRAALAQCFADAGCCSAWDASIGFVKSMTGGALDGCDFGTCPPVQSDDVFTGVQCGEFPDGITNVTGGGWKHVRHIPQREAWHPATDNLRGTARYGNPNDSTQPWSVPFTIRPTMEYLFASSDCQKWLVAHSSQVLADFNVENEARQVSMSSESLSPHSVRWFIRAGNCEDPWISLTDHRLVGGGSPVGGVDVVYGECNNPGHGRIRDHHGGMEVYVRSTATSFVCPSGWRGHCGAITREGTWAAAACESQLPFACRAAGEALAAAGVPHNCTGDGGRCFAVPATEGRSWAEAEAECKQHGGHLATVESFEAQALLEQMQGSRELMWIGIADGTGRWGWSDGREVEVTRWGPGEPGSAESWCEDVDECAEERHNCAASAACTNTPGSFECACEEGWRGDGVFCTEEDGKGGWVKILENAHYNGYNMNTKPGIEGFGTPAQAPEFVPLEHGAFRRIKVVHRSGYISCYTHNAATSVVPHRFHNHPYLFPFSACPASDVPIEERRQDSTFKLSKCEEGSCADPTVHQWKCTESERVAGMSLEVTCQAGGETEGPCASCCRADEEGVDCGGAACEACESVLRLAPGETLMPGPAPEDTRRARLGDGNLHFDLWAQRVDAPEVPAFLSKTIEQSCLLASETNTLSVSLSFENDMTADVIDAIVISGFHGARARGDVIQLVHVSGASTFCLESVPDQGKWEHGAYSLRLQVCAGSVVPGGSSVSFSFELVNPSASQASPALSIAVFAPGGLNSAIPATPMHKLSRPLSGYARGTEALFVVEPQLGLELAWMGPHLETGALTFTALLQPTLGLEASESVRFKVAGFELAEGAGVELPLETWGQALPLCSSSGAAKTATWDRSAREIVVSVCPDASIPARTDVAFSITLAPTMAGHVFAAAPFTVDVKPSDSNAVSMPSARVTALTVPVVGLSAIAQATMGLISLLPNHAWVLIGPGTWETCGLEIAQDGITLRGIGKPTWSCAGSDSRHMTVSGADISIRGLRFTGGKGLEGGSLLLRGQHARLVDCEFEYNRAHRGGAVASYGTLDLRGVVAFVKNVAEDGGGAVFLAAGAAMEAEECEMIFRINIARNGGAVFVSDAASVQLKGSGAAWMRLESNVATLQGGALFLGGGARAALEGSILFQRNTAEEQGGVLYCLGCAAVEASGDVVFRRNAARRGGAIASQDFTMLWFNGSSFVENTAEEGGAFAVDGAAIVQLRGRTLLEGNEALEGKGGGMLAENGATVDISGPVVLRNNRALHSVEARGGALFAAASCSVAISDGEEGDAAPLFERNLAGGFGGAICLEFFSQADISGRSRFEDNYASDSGGALAGLLNSGLMLRGKVALVRNNAFSNGGGALVGGAALHVSGEVVFEGNTALPNAGGHSVEWSSAGGAVAGYLGQIVLEGGVQLRGNRGWRGGAIGVQESDLTAAGVRFEENWSRGGGGAIIAWSENSCVIRDSVFKSNVVWVTDEQGEEFRGGAINTNYNTAVEIVRTRFEDHVSEYGGVVFLRGGTARFEEVTMSKNYAVNGGGCIVSDGTPMSLLDSDLAECHGSYAFSPAYLRCGHDRSFCPFHRSGNIGGAVEVVNADVVVLRSRVRSSSAAVGGAMHLSLGASLDAKESEFSHNFASVDGGGIAHFDTGAVHLESVSVVGNVARGGAGGGLLLKGPDRAILAGTNLIASNVAGTEGGGVVAIAGLHLPDLEADSATADLAKTLFAHNSAGASGGGAAVHSLLDLGLKHPVEFRNNSAAVDGGALLLSFGAQVTRKHRCTCPREYMTGRHFCTPNDECNSRACNWNNGACAIFEPRKFDQQCTADEPLCQFTNTIPQCDFNRGMCTGSFKQCPMTDAYLLHLYLDRDPKISPRPHIPNLHERLTWARGGSVDFGRCGIPKEKCIEPMLAGEEVFNGIEGRVGAGAISLDGASEWLHVHSTALLTEQRMGWTLECWVQLRADPSTGELTFLFASETMQVSLRRVGSAIVEVHVQAGGDTAAGCCMTVGRWEHLAVSMSEAAPIQIFVNGSMIDTGDALVFSPSLVGPLWGFAIGRPNPGGIPAASTHLQGAVDEVRVWRRARGRAEVADELLLPCRELVLSGPAEDALLLCYGFEQNPQPSHIPDESVVSGVEGEGIPARAISGLQHDRWCSTTVKSEEQGNLWGFCTDRPWLPGSGWDYDADHLLKLPYLSTQELFELHPACGVTLLHFADNRAGRNGGAVAKMWCSAEQSSPLCFIDGFDEEAADHSLTLFEGNIAGLGGGAVWDECRELHAPCQQTNRLLLALPWFSFGHALQKIQFYDNVAHGWGNDVATNGRRLHIFGVENPAWPTYEMVDLSPGVCHNSNVESVMVSSCWSPENLVKDGSGVLQMTYTKSSLWARYALMAIVAPWEAESVTIFVEELDFVCARRGILQVYQCDTEKCEHSTFKASFCGHKRTHWPRNERGQIVGGGNVTVEGGIVKFLFSSTIYDDAVPRRFVVRWQTNVKNSAKTMLPQTAYVPGREVLNFTLFATDGLGQRVRPSATSGALPSEHILAGTVCVNGEACALFSDGAGPSALRSLADAVDGYLPTAVVPQHLLCPWPDLEPMAVFQVGLQAAASERGAQLPVACRSCRVGETRAHSGGINASLGWTCQACDHGFYSAMPNRLGAQPPWFNCHRCPAGARCEGGRFLGGRVDGSVWALDAEHGYYVLQQCPPTHQLARSATGDASAFVHDEQTCIECKDRFEYIVSSAPGATCQPCPLGATCSASSFVPNEPDAKWEVTAGHVLRLLECPPGYIGVRNSDATFEAGPELDQCRQCEVGKFSLEPARFGGPLFVEASDLADSKCEECPPSASCKGTEVLPTKGFWRTPRRVAAGGAWGSTRRAGQSPEVEIVRCPPNACGENGVCEAGRRPDSVKCAVCMDGHVLSGQRCKACSVEPLSTGAMAAIVVVGSVVICVLYFEWPATKEAVMSRVAALRKKDGEEEEAKEGGKSALATHSRNLFDAARVALGFFQILATFGDNLAVEWSSELAEVFGTASVTSGSVSQMPGIDCVLGFGHEGDLVARTLPPLVPILLLVLLSFVPRWRGRSLWSPILTILLVFFPGATVVSVKSFVCDTVLGQNYLKSDYSVLCPKATRNWVYSYAVVSSVAFVLGVPLLVLVALFRFKVPELAARKQKLATIEAFVDAFQRRSADANKAEPRSLEFDNSQSTLVFPRLASHGGKAPDVTLSVEPDELSGAGETPVTKGFIATRMAKLLSVAAAGGAAAIAVTGSNFGSADNLTPEVERTASRGSGGSAVEQDGFGRTDSGGMGRAESSGRRLAWREGRKGDALCRVLEAMIAWSVDGDIASEDEKRALELKGREVRLGHARLMTMVASKAERLAGRGLIAVRRPVWDGSLGPEEVEAMEVVGMIFVAYYADSCFFEVWEFARKFFITAGISLILPGTLEQTEVALGFGVLALVVDTRAQPRVSLVMQGMQTLALSTLAYFLFLGAAIQVNQNLDIPSPYFTPSAQAALEVIGAVLCVLLVLFPLLARVSASIFARTTAFLAGGNSVAVTEMAETLQAEVESRFVDAQRRASTESLDHHAGGQQPSGPPLNLDPDTPTEIGGQKLEAHAAGVGSGSSRTLAPPPKPPHGDGRVGIGVPVSVQSAYRGAGAGMGALAPGDVTSEAAQADMIWQERDSSGSEALQGGGERGHAVSSGLVYVGFDGLPPSAGSAFAPDDPVPDLQDSERLRRPAPEEEVAAPLGGEEPKS